MPPQPPHAPPQPTTPIPPAFTKKESAILSSLSQDPTSYTDHSPKGTVDAAIKPLLDRLNTLDGVVTTSSCAGRMSVFLEGVKGGAREGDKGGWRGREEGRWRGIAGGEGGGDGVVGFGEGGEAKAAVPGGKGRGARWLFVSHEPLVEAGEHDRGGMPLMRRFGLCEKVPAPVAGDMSGMRFVRFQFEPMILHIMTASLRHAAPILAAAIGAGFRESGVQSLKNLDDGNAFPMVAVRSSGLAFESLVGVLQEMGGEGRIAGGGVVRGLVSEEYLGVLVKIANERFRANVERAGRFEAELFRRERGNGEWEDADLRRERKRAEGVQRKKVSCSEGARAGIGAGDGEDLMLAFLPTSP